MATVIRIRRTLVRDLAPAANSLAVGEMALELASDPVKIWVGVPDTIDPSERKLISGVIISATPPTDSWPGALWWDTVTGQLFIYFDDGTSEQWVSASSGAGEPGGSGGAQVGIGPSLPSPSEAEAGDLFWTDAKLFLFDGSDWVIAGGGGVTQQDLDDAVERLERGITDGSTAQAGEVGEVVNNTLAPATLTTNSGYTNGASVTLSPGDWDVSASFVVAATTEVLTNVAARLNVTPNVPGNDNGLILVQGWSLTNPYRAFGGSTPPIPVQNAVPVVATIQLYGSWSGSPTFQGYSKIHARRLR